MEDDHSPFLARGLPAVDIIDLTPFGSYHHTAQDTLDKCSWESLAVVGQVVMATPTKLEQVDYYRLWVRRRGPCFRYLVPWLRIQHSAFRLHL